MHSQIFLNFGLSIVKRIIESYSGKIKVESEYGSGTSIKVFLPY